MALDTRAWARVAFEKGPIEGDSAAHLDRSQIQAGLEQAQDSFVQRWGLLEAIVVRSPDGRRIQPLSTEVSIEGGLAGDRWVTGKATPGNQLSMMNLDVAAVIAGGQSIALFGDNLFTRLDLRESMLPVGTKLRVGEAVMVVSDMPHVPCDRFLARFGEAAFKAAAQEPRLRGIYLTVLEGGTIALGDPVAPLQV